MSESNDKDRVSFEEVRKLARPDPSPGPVAERAENSGLINLTAMIAGQTKSPPNVEKTLVRAEPTQAHGPSTPTTPATPKQKRRDGRVWVALATGVALGLLAGGVLFAMRGAGGSAAANQNAAAKPNVPATPAALGDRAANPTAPPWADGTQPTAIESVPHATNAASSPVRNAPSESSRRDSTVSPPTTAPWPPTAQAKTKTAGAAATDTPPGTAVGKSADETLEALMKRSIGASAQTAMPAAGSLPESPAPAGGSLPAKPALGAVQGAIGTVLPGARSCLGPDDPVSHATITFQSDGSVKALAVSGHASGEPAEECIRSRLMAARVPPFSSPTFTWTVTVRPAS